MIKTEWLTLHEQQVIESALFSYRHELNDILKHSRKPATTGELKARIFECGRLLEQLGVS